jgi:hypothetical protein
MTKRKVKAEIKGPDIVMRTIGSSYNFVRTNLRLLIIALVACVVMVSAAYAYIYYENKKSDKYQYLLAQGIKTFEEYGVSGKQDDLIKAENTFKDIAGQKTGKAPGIAKLYLARIQYMQGKNDEAIKLYRQILQHPPDPLIQALAEKAITQIEKK